MRRVFLLTLLSAGAMIAYTAVPAALFDSGTAGVSAFAKGKRTLDAGLGLKKHEPPPPRSGTFPPLPDGAYRRGLSVSPERVREGDRVQ